MPSTVRHTSVVAAELAVVAVEPADGFTESAELFAPGESASLHPAKATESAMNIGADR
jgi:hypothetical protein